jgi:electron transfer flavoprotein alpha/beta subunit
VPDAENSLLGRHLAAALGVPAVSWVDAIEEAGPGRAVAKRAVEMGYEFIEVPFPALLSMGVALLEDDPRAPRPAKAMLKLKMKKADVPVVSPADAGAADPAALVAMKVARMEAIPPRVVESQQVDPESEAALKGMLDAVLKGE